MAETVLVDGALEKALAFLQQRIRIEAAYLFGSQVEGTPHPDSDIDLAVFSPDVESMRFMERVRLGSELAMECHPDVELHLYSSDALANARPTNFVGHIIEHGRRLM